MATLAYKYDLDFPELLASVVRASRNGQAKCGRFRIALRESEADSKVFLLMNHSSIVAQVRLPDKTIIQLSNRSRMQTSLAAVQPRRVRKPQDVLRPKRFVVKDLRSGMGHVNLTAKVLDVSEPRQVYSKFGMPLLVSTAIITDGTGRIKMSLWNEQVGTVNKGDVIEIENGQVRKYNGEIQLTVGRRYGRIKVTSQIPAR